MLAAIVAVPIAFFAGTREAAKFASLSRKSGGAFREIKREWNNQVYLSKRRLVKHLFSALAEFLVGLRDPLCSTFNTCLMRSEVFP